MQKLYRCALAVALVAVFASQATAGELKVSISNGLVTIVADEVPVSRILSEWARVGQMKVVNGDKLLTTVSLQLIDVPERKALDILLRSASGYMVAERQVSLAGASAFDRVMILPFSKGPANTMPAASVPAPFNPRPMPQPDMDEEPVILPPGVGPTQQPQPGNMPSLPGMPPQGQQGQPQQNPTPTTLPRPGMLPQPGPQQPVPFGSVPGMPPKPPGGGGGSGI